MVFSKILESFAEELEKTAAKVPFIHGTSGKWDVLAPGIGPTVLRGDPNARAVYTAMKSRTKLPGVQSFAEEAARARGGEPMVAHGKMDTRKGWLPFQLSAWGRKNIGDIDAAHELVSRLDTTPKADRGKIWETLHRGVGSWRNQDPGATLTPTRYVPATTAQQLKRTG